MNGTGKKRQSGFSLVELMLAMVATAILSLAVGIMLVYAFRGWRQNTESVQMQRNATLAMRVMAREIRRTPVENISAGSSSLICTNASGTVFIRQQGGDLSLQVDTERPFILVNDIVATFKTGSRPDGSVAVRLDLATGSDISTNSMVIYSRN
jgi:prepilin-type N-terminal cleavage/methylation domain-containing protein